jgi:NAD(P)H-dependent flavin oxidoreductase YrpB (nitropropane dioxygenase family)
MDQMEVIFDERVPVFASGLGSPAFLLKRAHELGMQVWGLVGKPRQAKRQIEAGTDVIIAQGYDAAGHTGNIGTFSIVPQVVDAARGTGVCVIAAGGVVTGRHLAAALALGADGVWTGSLWLTSRESDVNLPLKERLLEAETEDAVISDCISGYTMRTTRSPWHDSWMSPEAPEVLKPPLQMMLSANYIQGSLATNPFRHRRRSARCLRPFRRCLNATPRRIAKASTRATRGAAPSATAASHWSAPIFPEGRNSPAP